MTVKVRIRDGLKKNPATGLGGATEGHIRGALSDMVAITGGVANKAGGHLLVQQATPTPNMTVRVADGVVYIPNTSYTEDDVNDIKFWEAVVDSQANLTIGANASGSTRIDLICAKMDTGITSNEYADNIATIVVVAGTPGAGIPATPSNHEKLYEITVANGASSIVTANITDVRRQVYLKAAWIDTFLYNSPAGTMLNGRISVSVATDDLTVAIKGMDGNDPSPTNPVYIRIENTIRSITAALSVTFLDGSNFMNLGSSNLLGGNENDIFVYIGYNVTDGVVIGISRIPYGRVYGDFDQSANTNAKWLGVSTFTNAVSTDPYVVIGRFAATLSTTGTGFKWTVPTFTNKNLVQRPIFETRWLAWTPTRSWTNGPTSSATVFRYKIINDMLRIHYHEKGTANGSNSTLCDFDLPMPLAAAILTASSMLGFAPSCYVDTGNTTGSQVAAFASQYNAHLYINFTSSKPVVATVEGQYEI